MTDLKYPFGERYRDAHLAKLDQSPENINKIFKWFEEKKDILYLGGNVGTGKTYTAAAIYNRISEKDPYCIRAYKEYTLLAHLRETIERNWDPVTELERLCESQYFILDDLGSSQMTDWQKEMLFNLVDSRSNSRKPTIITTNLSSEDIHSIFHERMKSRIFAANNTVIENRGPDRRKIKE